MLQVLQRTGSAASGVSTCEYPQETSVPMTFSESRAFIWQPKVSM
jgi:hypothetical protein